MINANKTDLSLTVKSTNWINDDTVKIQVNSDLVFEQALSSKNSTPNLNHIQFYQINTQLNFTKDSFVTVETISEANDNYKAIYPEINFYSFSNAIYIDHD